jgi:stage V sporulation protein D (sporulation-specific penicillin-binding protein)
MILDESDSYSIYGSNLVAPYVGKMMSDILPYIGVAAEFDDDQETVSRVVGKTKSAAESTLVKKGFKVNVVGSGDTVVSQFPAGGTVVGVGSTITLYTDADSSAQTVTVPNFVGYSPSTVSQIANNNKLNVKIIGASNGSTTVSVSQNIAKGEEVQIGTVIEVVFREQVAGD